MERSEVRRGTIADSDLASGPGAAPGPGAPTSRPRSTAVVLVATMLFALLTACGDGTSAGPGGESPAVSTAPVEIAVTVSRGRVTPATSRVDVARGSLVRITVATDIADEVHVHGYDLSRELPARGAATIEFVADRTGLFEVETHHSGLVICQLLIR